MLESKTNRIILYVSTFFIIVLMLFALMRDNADTITLSEATKLLDSKEVKSVVASDEYVYLKTQKDFFKIASSQVTPQMFSDYKVKIQSGYHPLVYLLFFILFLGIGSLVYNYFSKKKQDFSIKSEQKSSSSENLSIEPIKSDVRFSDIGGISEVKVELEEIISFIKNPKKYKNFGARLPKGVLLVGPPGVGKTMIAKAVANAADVPFYYQSGASFVQIYVGMGAKRVHELFLVAKNNAPSIIFIDEIDAVGKKRDGTRNDEREATLNQLLTEMDGFESSNGVIVIAATNKIDVLDSALLRAGRFDRRIFVELPTKKERSIILSKYLAKVPNSVNIEALSDMTTGFNGAALAALVNEASLLALRLNAMRVSDEHFYEVKDRVAFGKKKLQLLTLEQKEYRITYQAAKAVVATYFDLAFDKLLLSNEKLTPQSEEPLLKHELESRLKVLLAGVVACQLSFNEHMSSAKSDLDEAKELAKKMTSEYGMGDDIFSSEGQDIMLLNRLFLETKKLLSSLDGVMSIVKDELRTYESISKEFIKKHI